MSERKEACNEREMLRAVLNGRKEAYADIFKLHRHRAYGLAYQYTGNKEDALDVVQDAFIRAYINLKRFDLGREFGPWLLTIVRNLSIDLLRKRKSRAAEDLPEVLPDLRSRTRADEELLRLEVRTALLQMEPGQREIIFLKDYQGHSYAEIAEIIDIPLGTVMSRLHHARKRLAQLVRKTSQ